MRVHHINNVNKVLQVLSENGVRLLNISSEDIVGGNPKYITLFNKIEKKTVRKL